MKLPVRQVADPPTQQNFEAIEQHDLDVIQRNVAGATPLKIASGIGTVTFTASTLSAITAIPHGMATTPASVQVTPRGVDAKFNATLTGGAGATTFPVQASYPTNLTGDYTFYWLAIG